MPPRRGVIDRVRRWRTTSGTLCRAPRSAWPEPDSARSAKDRFPRILVKGCGFLCPERLPSTSAPWGSAFTEPDLVGARHRCLGFAAEDPASGAPSPLRCSRPEWLDPALRSSALHRGGRAGQTPPVDFCNQSRSASTTVGPSEPRAPHPWSPRSAAVFRTAPLRQRDGLRVAVREARPTKTSRARGRLEGVCPRCTAPPAAIARGGSFTPTRSARTPHVVGSWRRRLEADDARPSRG
jgi:hypothetical protein